MSKVAKYKGQKWANFIHLSLAHWLLVAPAPNVASVSGELSLCPRSGDWGRCPEPGVGKWVPEVDVAESAGCGGPPPGW